jgi:coproporphyrinogen III oxidase
MRDQATDYFRILQDRICAAIAALDGGTFREDTWDRPGGGGGRSRILVDGPIFEKAGVNFSEVFGELSPEFAKQLPGDGATFTATGISLVLHPRSPHVPTVHANFRYLTHGAKAWFGGGADLTPYYPFKEDVVHFHRTWQTACRRHAGVIDYEHAKAECDKYFYLPHRQEARGVGGIFFDYLAGDPDATFAFVQECGSAFLEAYLPIVRRRLAIPYTDRQRRFQHYRRGRYVEFNLIYDRGTLFGLKTHGRIESILMSLPAIARWDYDYVPEPESPEAELTEYYLQPRAWADESEG